MSYTLFNELPCSAVAFGEKLDSQQQRAGGLNDKF